MKKKYLILFLCELLFWSCENKNYFAGKVVIVNDFEKEYSLRGTEIKLNGVYAGYMSVYDTLMLFCPGQDIDYMMLPFNLNNGKELKPLFKVGRGPNEFKNMNHYEQYVKDGNDIKLWTYDEDKFYMLVNLSRSIELKSDSLVIDSIIPIETKKITANLLGMIFALDSSKFLVNIQSEKAYYKDPKYIPGKYSLYHGSSDSVIQHYSLFNKPIINRVHNMAPNIFYASYDRIKPDKSKIAMAMSHLAQINILDLKTGNLKGFRLKGSPDFDYLEGSPEDFKTYYQRLSVDNQYIYAIYENRPSFGNHENEQKNTIIHVFDWNGKPVCRLILAEVLSQMTLDPVTGYLYGKTHMEEIFRYDLKSVLPQ